MTRSTARSAEAGSPGCSRCSPSWHSSPPPAALRLRRRERRRGQPDDRAAPVDGAPSDDDIAALTATIAGGGSSFQDTFQQAVNADFNGIAGAERVTYAKSGSSDGRRQLAAGTLDFAGSDSLPKDDETFGGTILYFPIVAAPITVSYNLEGVDELNLSPEIIAGIFQAEITTWDDPAIKADNPDADLPSTPITVVHRSDGSGTTNNFTKFLAAAAPETWTLGSGDEVNWPASTQGAEKNSGVAEVIKKTDGAVGYVDLADAGKAGLSVARIGNSTGEFVPPTVAAVQAALDGAEIADDLTYNPLNSPGDGAYPITAPTWILAIAEQTDAGKADTLKTYLHYVLTTGQEQAQRRATRRCRARSPRRPSPRSTRSRAEPPPLNAEGPCPVPCATAPDGGRGPRTSSVRPSVRPRELHHMTMQLDRDPAPPQVTVDDLTTEGRGAGADRLFRRVALLAGGAVLLILLLIAVTTTQQAWPAFSEFGLDYFVGTEWIPSEGLFGILPLVYGTVVVSLIAIVFAVPVSIGIALFVTEVAHRRIRGGITMVIDLLAAVPSVVFGLWGFYQLIPIFQSAFNSIAMPCRRSRSSTRSSHAGSGSSFMIAGIVLALMITPIITSVTREVFMTVPGNDKYGALALGATRWEMIRGVVIPHSSGGLTGAVMLGLGRAMGETVAVALLIGASPQISVNLFGRGETMPAQIFRNLSEAGGTYRSALIGLGVCLFVLTIVINISARRLVVLVDRRTKGIV